LLPTYLLIGGMDWIATLEDMMAATRNNSNNDIVVQMGVDAVLYLFRHVLLYVGLSKFLLDWKTK
jgi:hypothetical protein